jgi:hypothetical protein
VGQQKKKTFSQLVCKTDVVKLPVPADRVETAVNHFPLIVIYEIQITSSSVFKILHHQKKLVFNQYCASKIGKKGFSTFFANHNESSTFF